MSDYKEIRLTEEIPTPVDVAHIEAVLKTGTPVLIVPPKHKVIKLADLPDGYTVRIDYDDDCAGDGFVKNGKLYKSLNANYGYREPVLMEDVASIELLQGPKTVWEGGECPVPDGVIVTVGFRNNTTTTDLAVKLRWEHFLNPSLNDSEIYRLQLQDLIMNDIIWYQITGNLADGYVVEG